MTKEEKAKFDWLNKSSYLFRLCIMRLGFDIECTNISNTDVWHLFYKNVIIGTITFRTDEKEFTYCNLRLYKYFQQKFPELKDFLMSSCYEFENNKPVKFLFDKFDEYFIKIRNCVLTILPKENESVQSELESINLIDDSISRLKEYCEEYDSNFSNNIMLKDITNLLKENERLQKENKKYSKIIEDLILLC